MRWWGWLLYLLLIASAWLLRGALFELARDQFALVAAFAGGLTVLVILGLLIERRQSYLFGQVWRERLAARETLPAARPWWRPRREAGPLERRLAPLFRGASGQALLSVWRDAGFGGRAVGLLCALLLAAAVGYLPGYLLTRRALLGSFTAFLAWIGLAVLVYGRARAQRRRFGDQFPDVLDRLSDALQAGFSLPQAMSFIVPNLLEPSAGEMARLSAQIELGLPVDDALIELYRRRPGEDVRLLVEGLTLQRQVGGDMPAMMRQMAAFVRQRVELEREVRTLTAQGRLSAMVIALLVPVSLGVLSMFPGYTAVLFQTTVGNLVLITAGMLELVGAALVVRLIRIDY